MQDDLAPRLHTPPIIQGNSAAIRRTLLLLGVWTAVCAAAVAYSLWWRDATYMHNVNETKSQLLTIGVTILWAWALIFLYSMKLSPRLAYRRYLRDAYGGLSKEITGDVIAVDAQTTHRDGLSFYGILLRVGVFKNEDDVRQLYWDAQLGRPEVETGQNVWVRVHDNDIIGIRQMPR